MDTRIRGPLIKSVSLLFVLACLCSCNDKKIEERLKSLSGNEYLALSQEEKSDIVKKIAGSLYDLEVLGAAGFMRLRFK